MARAEVSTAVIGA